MGRYVDYVRVNVSILEDMGGPEAAALSVETSIGDSPFVIDESKVDADLERFFVARGGRNTLTVHRRSSWGGWGVDSLRVLEYAIQVSSAVLAGVTLDALRAGLTAMLRRLRPGSSKAHRSERKLSATSAKRVPSARTKSKGTKPVNKKSRAKKPGSRSLTRPLTGSRRRSRRSTRC